MSRVRLAVLDIYTGLITIGYYLNGKFDQTFISLKHCKCPAFVDTEKRLRFSSSDINEMTLEIEDSHFEGYDKELEKRFGNNWKNVIVQSIKTICSGLILEEIAGFPNTFTKPKGLVWTDIKPKIMNNQVFPKMIGTGEFQVWIPGNGDLFDESSIEVDCIPVYDDDDPQLKFDF